MRFADKYYEEKNLEHTQLFFLTGNNSLKQCH